MRRLAAATLLAPLVAAVLAPVAAAAERPQVRVVRVDVSQRPRIGVVVTVPGAAPAVPDVHADGATGPVWVRPLSSADLAVVVAPDRADPRWPDQRRALVRFLLGLPTDVRAAVADGRTPTAAPRRDVLAAVQQTATLGPDAGRPAYDRLLAALDALPQDPRSRRVVLLAGARDLPADPAVARYLQRRLAASGTALYLLDRSPAGLPVLGRLAGGSGGRVVAGRGGRGTTLQPVLAELASQYHLTFTRRAALPGTDRLLVAVRGRQSAVVPVALPAAAPAPPGPAPAVRPPSLSPARVLVPVEALLPLVAGLLVVVGVGYGVGMLVASRRSPRTRVPEPVPTDDLFYVFLLPCLNEERVIRASLERLAAIPADNHAALVIDDGSDDGTAALVGEIVGERVWLLRRVAPDARQGKGEALNAAVAHLLAGRLRGRDPDKVIIAVVDADGRLDPGALAAVAPFFADPAVGGVQIGVRINNRFTNLLARLQDMEFVIYTDVFQRGRRHLGSVGMGGNGQFMRLSALLSLAEGPWTRSLTEDLDLGVRLLNLGWRNEFCRHAAVHQQGVVQLRRLVRQRSRWFQGHLQSWRLVPSVLRSAPRLAAPDLVYHLTSPALLLIGSLLTASFLVSLLAAAGALLAGHPVVGWWVATTYTLSFGPALAYTAVYWGQERRNGLRLHRAVLLAHLYVLYGLVWAAAGWWGLARQLRGRTGWAKTERVVEAPQPVAAVPGGTP